MNTIPLENAKPHLQRSRWCESSERLFRSLSRVWLILFALVALASTSQAGDIVGITNCSCTNLTIQLSDFPPGAFVATLGGVLLDGTYDYASQTIVASRPGGLAAGTYLLAIWQAGQQSTVPVASTNVFVCACLPCDCPPGPQGPPGPAGATGPTGPQGPKGDKGATGLTGLAGPTGPAGARGPAGTNGVAGPPGTNGLNGAVGPAGPPGTNGLNGINGTNGLPGPAGPPGTNGLNGINGTNGLPGPAGPPGTNGLNGINGTNGVNGINGTSGSSQYGYIYNLTAQAVAINAVVPFDSNGVLTAGITHAPGSSDIIVVNAGDYKVTFSVSGTEPGQFALFLNGVQVPGTVYGSGAGTQQDNGQCIIAIGANDVLTLRNRASAAAVGLQSLAGGTEVNVNASIVIQKLN